jgi:hypothetical protein
MKNNTLVEPMGMPEFSNWNKVACITEISWTNVRKNYIPNNPKHAEEIALEITKDPNIRDLYFYNTSQEVIGAISSL